MPSLIEKLLKFVQRQDTEENTVTDTKTLLGFATRQLHGGYKLDPEQAIHLER